MAPNILTEGRSNPCESKQKSESRLQQESYEDSPAASGHDDAEKIQQIASLLTRQVWSPGSKNLQRKDLVVGMILLEQA